MRLALLSGWHPTRVSHGPGSDVNPSAPLVHRPAAVLASPGSDIASTLGDRIGHSSALFIMKNGSEIQSQGANCRDEHGNDRNQPEDREGNGVADWVKVIDAIEQDPEES